MTSGAAPPGFKGRFLTLPEDRATFAVSTGPYRSLPVAVAEPATVDDAASLVRWAASANTALIPRGAGTGMPGGNVGPWVVAAMGPGFDEVGAVDLEAHTLRVGTGVVAARVQAAAEAVGLDFPPIPSSAAWATVGGMVSAGAAGARSFGLGAVGEWVEAVEVVLADGSVNQVRRGEAAGLVLGPTFADELAGRSRALLPDWPDVRKNASGYRLDRFLASGDVIDLLVASEGTLGLITSVTLRLRQQPVARELAVVGAAGVAEVDQWAGVARDVRASACEFIGSWLVEKAGLRNDFRIGHLVPSTPRAAVVMIELEGDRDEIETSLGHLREAARSLSPGGMVHERSQGSELWRLRTGASPTIQRAAQAGLRSMQFIEDCVVPPGRLAAYAEGLNRILADAATDAALFGHAGDANVHVNPLIDVSRSDWRARVRAILEQTVSLVCELGGTLTGEHGDGRVRTPFLPKVWGVEAVGAFTALKNYMDPNGILNPGVVVPIAGQDPLEYLSAEMPMDPHSTVGSGQPPDDAHSAAHA